MKLSQTLIGKNVTFTAHHDAFPSMHYAGIITSVKSIKYSTSKVEYTIKGEYNGTFQADKFTVQSLVDTGEYVSDSFASRESRFIYIK